MDLPNYNYKLLIAYDGTFFNGWQIQPNGQTIQEEIIKALATILKTKEIILIGSGRTDSGVHAKGQVAHFKWTEPLDLYRLQSSLNGILPGEIRVQEVEPVPLDFHAQYSAKGKVYHYQISMEKYQDPFHRRYSYHLRHNIDIEVLRQAAREFVGTHDFTSFANESHAGSAAHDPVRTLKRLDIFQEGSLLRLEFEGDGFLYKMVRNITGTLIEVAAGKRKVEDIKQIILAKDRRQAGRAVPPHGLFLMRVIY